MTPACHQLITSRARIAAVAGSWTCDHASNRVPPEIAGGDLGLPARRHRRATSPMTVGAAGVARALAAAARRAGDPVGLLAPSSSTRTAARIDPTLVHEDLRRLDHFLANRGMYDAAEDRAPRLQDASTAPTIVGSSASYRGPHTHRLSSPSTPSRRQFIGRPPAAPGMSVCSTPATRGWPLPLAGAAQRPNPDLVHRRQPALFRPPARGDALDRHGVTSAACRMC